MLFLNGSNVRSTDRSSVSLPPAESKLICIDVPSSNAGMGFVELVLEILDPLGRGVFTAGEEDKIGEMNTGFEPGERRRICLQEVAVDMGEAACDLAGVIVRP